MKTQLLIFLLVLLVVIAEHLIIRRHFKSETYSSLQNLIQGHPSALHDLSFWLAVSFFIPILSLDKVLPNMSLGGSISNFLKSIISEATISHYSLISHFVDLSNNRLLLWSIYFVSTDFCQYLSHRMFHKFPPLWFFHSYHHEPEVFSVFTTARFALSESAITGLIIVIFTKYILGLPEYETILPVVTFKLVFE